ncbi:MAG: hypothetical protein IJX28_05005 [Clostridia bacterium]|nr:hypothetical protein [Clostridia bacterium]
MSSIDHRNLPEGLECKDHTGAGYNCTHLFEGWRVAFLNYADRFDTITYLERHMLTDEVFVLLEGRAELWIGRDCVRVPMVPHKIYNVKKAVWHNIRVSRDAKVLIVENSETAKENSEYIFFEK